MTDADAEPAAPTCYRHPDRETYVRCTRCERPICPDCMRDAAVGFQCPECVREGNKNLRERRTVFGGRVTADANAVRVIIGACVVAYLIQYASGTGISGVDSPQGGLSFTERFLMVGSDFAVVNGALERVGVAHGEWYRLITSAFLHGGLLHLGFNMYALYAFGTMLERLLGTGRFVVVFVLSAVAGSALTYVIEPGAASVGASGAVFGVLGGVFVAARRARIDTSQIVGLIVINLVLGFVIPGINNYAHMGGLVAGVAMTFAFAHLRGPQRDLLHGIAAAALAALLGAVIAIKTAQIRDTEGLGAYGRAAVTAATTESSGTPSR